MLTLNSHIQFLTDIAGWLPKPTEQASSIHDTFASTFAAMVWPLNRLESIVYETHSDTLKLWDRGQ